MTERGRERWREKYFPKRRIQEGKKEINMKEYTKIKQAYEIKRIIPLHLEGNY